MGGYTHGKKWSDELVESEIRNIMNKLKLNRMPTNSEIVSITKNFSLSSKISKCGGMKRWADKLNLQIKESETSLGMDYENIVNEMLINRNYKVQKMAFKHPYDLLINESIKIDVKASRPYIGKDNSRYHTFNLEKKFATCDFYIAIALDGFNQIEKLLIIPSSHAMKNQLSIGKISKYDKYQDRWDLIEAYDNFHKNLI